MYLLVYSLQYSNVRWQSCFCRASWAVIKGRLKQCTILQSMLRYYDKDIGSPAYSVPYSQKPKKQKYTRVAYACGCCVQKVTCRFYFSLFHFGDNSGTSTNLVLLKRCTTTRCDWSGWWGGVIHVFLWSFFSSSGGALDLFKPEGERQKKREKSVWVGMASVWQG